MKKLLLVTTVIFVSLFSCKKEDPNEVSYREQSDHLCVKWKVVEANKNSTGNIEDNGENVLYDWYSWTVEFWPKRGYKTIEYSPDSTVSIVETGYWQLYYVDHDLTLTGTSNLIEFSSGTIIDEGSTDRFWVIKKNEDNQLWLWIEDSYYASTGVFLKLVPE